MIRFQAPQLPPVEQVAAYFARAEAVHWYSNRGPCHELLVERLVDFLGHVRCVPVANATLGLMLGLRALVGARGGRRREVLMPSFTFAATINAVRFTLANILSPPVSCIALHDFARGAAFASALWRARLPTGLRLQFGRSTLRAVGSNFETAS